MDVMYSKCTGLNCKKAATLLYPTKKDLCECVHLFDIPADDEVNLKEGILLVQLAKYYSWWREWPTDSVGNTLLN
jgi:hypothetical protein